jgi:alanyl-tRNA synthetase
MAAASVNSLNPKMTLMKAADIRKKYLEFFERQNHAIIPSAPLIPENDPTVLFTTAGMHPLVPYLLGEPHPEGQRLANVQKCIRTGDIEEVGDNRHLTFFEMLGNWSLGDYFKAETIAWSWEFLTGKDWMGLDPNRLYVTVFAGDEDAVKDQDSINIWKEQFARADIEAHEEERIFSYGKKDNWWGPAGQTGPCGPDSEMFYDTLNLPTREAHAPGWTGSGECQPSCDCGRYVEVWNDVFMQYYKQSDGRYRIMDVKNVDTGMGLERMAMVMQGTETVFETDLFQPLIQEIERLSGKKYDTDTETTRLMRVVADHVRSATFIIGDQRGVTPSNMDQGYVLRRLIRRAVRCGRQLGIEAGFSPTLAEIVIRDYSEQYPELAANRERVVTALQAEEEKFSRTLQKGLQEVNKVKDQLGEVAEVPGKTAFFLYESFGFPKELTEEVVGKPVNEEEWAAEMKRHQETSRAGSEQKFASGLADHSDQVVKLHTATHLLHQALRTVLGEHVEQKGSNITADRLRFDFSHPEKLTPEQIAQVEAIVNEQIEKDFPVSFKMMTAEEAKASGAIGLFEDKYAELGSQIKVYTVGDSDEQYFSREICSGPHVEHTGVLGKFRVKKEQASSAGVRRIKAVLE